MKLIFSEYKSDYGHYIFPYAIWALPQSGDRPSSIFQKGFLPSARDLSRYYMCRQIRVKLRDYRASSENRRILKKGKGITYQLLARAEFEYDDTWRTFCKNYADIKFGKDVMSKQRLDSLFDSDLITHVLLFTDTEKNQNVGLTTLYLEKKELAYYYYAFYDLNYYTRNLGMFMMTSAVEFFSNRALYLYLGTCYSRTALYKTQFRGAEFFTGLRWSNNLKELKYLIERDDGAVTQHLVETEEYRHKFYGSDFPENDDSDFFLIPTE